MNSQNFSFDNYRSRIPETDPLFANPIIDVNDPKPFHYWLDGTMRHYTRVGSTGGDMFDNRSKTPT